MKIGSVGTNFGKKLIATCTVKQDGQKHKAGIWKYDPYNIGDIEEIETSMEEGDVKHQYRRAGSWRKGNYHGDFYALKDIETGQIASAAEIKEKNNAISILELQNNTRYTDALTPTISYIAYKGWLTEADKIETAFRAEDNPNNLSKYKFDNKGELYNWEMPAKRFQEAISTGEERHSLIFRA